MYKIRRISFINHPVLKNLSLDFCDFEGNAVDTVIIAGENGAGKSTILDCLYKIVSNTINFEAVVEIEENNQVTKLTYDSRTLAKSQAIFVNDGRGFDDYVGNSYFQAKYPMCGIFSDVDINFRAKNPSSVTSMVVDSAKNSRRSDNNMSNNINQLLIDIQAADDADLAKAYKEAKNTSASTDNLDIDIRIGRFTKAFNKMFEDLTYSHVENTGSHKSIIFSKNGNKIPIENLSSGEKQIVYRGCFLLKDINAINGAFVFIDEPEISLHPSWQIKVMDYYKGMFTDKNGIQTSQIFVVTHSPFIIHNENRYNDKVIVCSRNENGDIEIKDKPDYYKCTSSEAVYDAFKIESFEPDIPTVYLEGRTDEMYFNKALEVFDYDNIPFKFKWIGYINENNGQEENTGSGALDKAVHFLIGHNLPRKNICLYDCDTKKDEFEKNNVFVKVIPKYENARKMKKGIENALILDDILVDPFYSEKEKEGDYGEKKKIQEFEKMEFCNYICGLNKEVLKEIFANLKTVIDDLITVFDKE